MISFLGKKRAQAAVELLTTYGWAIMGVLIVIGALSYFDVFDGERFVSERCDTGNQIQCLEAYADNNDKFQIALRNNYLVAVVIEDIYVNGIQLYPNSEFCMPGNCGYVMSSGNVTIFTTEDFEDLIKGDKEAMDIQIVFRRNVSGIDECYSEATGYGGMCYNISGTLVVKIQDAANGIGPLNE